MPDFSHFKHSGYYYMYYCFDIKILVSPRSAFSLFSYDSHAQKLQFS
jgi:hypothetical protein